MSEQTLLSSKEKARELLLYLFFGVLATCVYFLVRFTVFALNDSATFSTAIANIVAILFAFVTNKLWVFKHQNQEKSIWLQFFHFVLGRLGVFALDLAIAHFAVDKYHDFFIQLFHLNAIDYTSFLFNNTIVGSPYKLENFLFAMLSQVIAIVTNYLISKFIVFKK